MIAKVSLLGCRTEESHKLYMSRSTYDHYYNEGQGYCNIKFAVLIMAIANGIQNAFLEAQWECFIWKTIQSYFKVKVGET